MSQDIRRELIARNLGIKPINHGLVYTFQIALPESKQQPIPLERRQALERSLLAHNSNLVSLIIRRTEAYDDEDIEYELVYGADWLQVAQDLDIEKVWAWVFDLTDEQAIATANEMGRLANATPDSDTTDNLAQAQDGDIAALIDQKLQLSTTSIKSVMTHALKEIKDELDEKLKLLHYRIDTLSESQTSSDSASDSAEILKTLRDIEQKLEKGRKLSREKDPHPINLLESSNSEIEAALRRMGVNSQQIKAALRAVDKWKTSTQDLSWDNLERSATAGKSSPDKVNGFGRATYDSLWSVASIPGDPKDLGSGSDGVSADSPPSAAAPSSN